LDGRNGQRDAILVEFETTSANCASRSAAYAFGARNHIGIRYLRDAVRWTATVA
jgi:hypothetical protein